MSPELKKAIAKSAEGHLFLALEDIKKIGKLLVESTENSFDDIALQGVLMFESQLKDLIDKVDGEKDL